RPHRRPCIESLPSAPAIVTEAQLRWLASQTPRPSPRPARSVTRATDRLDMTAEFQRRALYRKDLSGGKHAVQCPWHDQHSGQSGVTETVLYAPRTLHDPFGVNFEHEHRPPRTN